MILSIRSICISPVFSGGETNFDLESQMDREALVAKSFVDSEDLGLI